MMKKNSVRHFLPLKIGQNRNFTSLEMSRIKILGNFWSPKYIPEPPKLAKIQTLFEIGKKILEFGNSEMTFQSHGNTPKFIKTRICSF